MMDGMRPTGDRRHGRRIAVVGDVLLDVDLLGRADRLSPDAPVPVVSVERSVGRAGGAGLVATLLARDGVDVVLVTALGDDDRVGELRAALDAVAALPGAGSISVVAGPAGAPTPVKTRVRGDGHAIVRIDEGCEPPGAPTITADMLDALDEVDAVVVADYGRGVAADPRLRDALDRVGGRIPVVWDPHRNGSPPVRAAAVVTPNRSEAFALADGLVDDGASVFDDLAGVDTVAAALLESWGCEAVLVTLGAKGALLRSRDRVAAQVPHLVSATPSDGTDPCGAGDRLAATVASELAAGEPLGDAVAAGVAAAARFVASGGVASLDRPANTSPLRGDSADALAVAHATRERGGVVVATGGCFDLLHAGHARTLAAARALGDCLIVCVNSDDSVRRLKGPERPIMAEDDRSDLLQALECVDAVVVFEEDTPEAVLRRIRPDVWVKGGDYVAADLPETGVIAAWGGRTVTVPYHPGRSSTRLAGALARVG